LDTTHVTTHINKWFGSEPPPRTFPAPTAPTFHLRTYSPYIDLPKPTVAVAAASTPITATTPTPVAIAVAPREFVNVKPDPPPKTQEMMVQELRKSAAKDGHFLPQELPTLDAHK